MKILIHGSGHKAASWDKVISYMNNDKDILCPNLSTILNGKEASYDNLYSSFVEYCNKIDGKIDLCGLSLGGILALNYACLLYTSLANSSKRIASCFPYIP